jgi:glutaredoxin-like protein NrdH
LNYAQELQAIHRSSVILFSKPGCVQCDAMERKLKKHEISYHKVDITQDAAAYEFVKELGYAQVPVTYLETLEGEFHWSGYDTKEIERHLVPAAAAA